MKEDIADVLDRDLELFQPRDITIPIGFDKDLVDKIYWDREYIQTKISEIEDTSHKMLFTFLWMTGVRITEALTIKKERIDFKNYVVDIRWQKNEKKGTSWQRRVLPLHPNLKEYLQIYTAPMKTEQLVFPMTRQNAWYLSKKYFGGNPHKFRHSFAVNWLRCGGEVVILSRMLGHKNIRTTMEYLKIVPIDQGKELLKIKF